MEAIFETDEGGVEPELIDCVLCDGPGPDGPGEGGGNAGGMDDCGEAVCCVDDCCCCCRDWVLVETWSIHTYIRTRGRKKERRGKVYR